MKKLLVGDMEADINYQQIIPANTPYSEVDYLVNTDVVWYLTHMWDNLLTKSVYVDNCGGCVQ